MSLLAIWDYSMRPSEGTLKSERKAKVGAIINSNHGSQALELKLSLWGGTRASEASDGKWGNFFAILSHQSRFAAIVVT